MLNFPSSPDDFLTCIGEAISEKVEVSFNILLTACLEYDCGIRLLTMQLWNSFPLHVTFSGDNANLKGIKGVPGARTTKIQPRYSTPAEPNPKHVHKEAVNDSSVCSRYEMISRCTRWCDAQPPSAHEMCNKIRLRRHQPLISLPVCLTLPGLQRTFCVFMHLPSAII